MNTYDCELKGMIRKWIEEFRHSEFSFDGPDNQLAGFLTSKLQRSREPVLLNPDAKCTWKVCSMCGTPMDPQYDPSGNANNGNNCCGGR